MSLELWPTVDERPTRVVPPEFAYKGWRPSNRGVRGPDKKPRRKPGQKSIEVAGWPQITPIGSAILREDQIREQVPYKLGQLLHEYFGFEWQEFHLELLRLMFKGGKRVVNWPTDHGKSTITNYHFPILSLMNDPDASHILCGANENDSKSWVQTTQRALEGFDNRSAQLIQDYPWIRRPNLDVAQSWSTTQLTVAGRSVNKRNPSILAIGAGSQDIRGRRGKLILDDIEGVRHQSSPTERTKLVRWVKQECLRCYEDERESSRPLLLACGTPFDVDSIYFNLESAGWQAHRRPVYTDPPPWRSNNPTDHMPPRLKENCLLWPEKFKKIDEQYRGMNKEEFSIAYLMDPKAGDSSRLSLEEIQALTGSAAAPGMQAKKFVSLDPAGDSKTRTSDYAGLALVEINWPQGDSLPQVQVLDAYAMREGLFEQVNRAADWAKDNECAVIYEINGLGATYANAFEHLAPATRLIKSNTRQFRFETTMGITVVRTLVRENRLLIPASKSENPHMRAFRAEIRDLGGFKHDHISAAVWFVVRHIYEQVRLRGAAQLVSMMPARRFGRGLQATGFRTWRAR